MQLNDLNPKNKNKKKKRVGRGGKRGTYSGRGIKGQKARTGGTGAPIIRELIKKYPKLRGYNQEIPQNRRFKAEVNVSVLDSTFKDGETVSSEVLVEKNIVRRVKGRIPAVKILGDGSIEKKITVLNCKLSKSAAEKIKKAGGTIK